MQIKKVENPCSRSCQNLCILALILSRYRYNMYFITFFCLLNLLQFTIMVLTSECRRNSFLQCFTYLACFTSYPWGENWVKRKKCGEMRYATKCEWQRYWQIHYFSRNNLPTKTLNAISKVLNRTEIYLHIKIKTVNIHTE